MISFTEDKEQIIRVWQEAFGDSREEILYFINNIRHGKCLAYFNQNKAVSILYLVRCRCNGFVCNYIYAACTLNEFKGRGYMSRLLEYAKEYYSPLCLIPADDGLVEFYDKRGFKYRTSINDISFDENDEIKEYLLEGYELSEPSAMIFK